jgi:hypothetical protein
MQDIMQQWKDGKEPKVGPQNGRINALGIEGRTSLTNIPEGEAAAITRDFGAAKQAW